MSAFKNIVRADRTRTFLNFAEFGEKHEVDGKTCIIIIDNNERVERTKNQSTGQYIGGIFEDDILFYVRAEDLPGLPRINRLLSLDGRSFRVKDAIDEMGIFSITLEANDH